MNDEAKKGINISWLKDNPQYEFECSKCGGTILEWYDERKEDFKFCPWCGVQLEDIPKERMK